MRISDWSSDVCSSDLLPKVDFDLTQVHKPNSIALRMAMVAADEADLVATVRWGNEWDIAAAMLIAQEAGATVTDALGQKLSFNRENRSEEHTSELQSLMRNSYAVFCLKKKQKTIKQTQ